jgi:Ca2+-binding RTX toxin-like protein
VIASVFAESYTLPDNVENLTLAGGFFFDVSGNALANKIVGTSGEDVLYGLDGNDTLTGNGGADVLDGGAGADSMSGGIGDTSYHVDNVADKIVESADGGRDSVTSTISYTLGSNLEDLVLSNADGMTGTGNSLDNGIAIESGSGDNVLSGLAGNDFLQGNDGSDLLLGGDGNDTLEGFYGADTFAGGAGSDSFFFFTLSSLNGVDVITDFQNGPGSDVLDISDILAHFDAKSSDINDFVQTVESNGSTTVRVDTDGGGNSFVDLVVLEGVNTDVAALLNNGNRALPD